MTLSDVSIRRPIAVGCLIIALTLLGLNSFRKMGLENLPKMDVPIITIVTQYPGASPEEIETDIAKRIEDAVVSIDGLKHVNSSCMENVCQTTLEFNMDVDVDIAATDVREKIDMILDDFPDDVEDPQIQKFDVNAQPIITLALTGDAPLDELYDYADNELKDRITTISGVAEVELIGGAEREVRVLADREKLQARGLTTLDIYNAIQNGVRTIPSGRVQDKGTEYSVKFDADFATAAEIGQLEIANESGQRCRIADVARTEMATDELRRLATLDGQMCVTIRVVKKADANAVSVTNTVKKAMANLQKNLPGGMELVWVTDDGRFIEATVQSAWSDVFLGIVLTAAILFVFLYNFRTLLVLVVTMPLTIVIGLWFMQMVGYTLNSATLIAIGMSVGILVANSIVVLEGIVKRLDQGKTPREAASLGAKETFIAVLASAGTNTVVLFPLAIMESKVGMFIGPLAMTMVIMTLVSLFISFTLTPMLCSLLLCPTEKRKGTLLGWVEAGWNRGLAWVIRRYQGILGFLERHRWAAVLVVVGCGAMLFQSMGLVKDIGFSLVQESDRGEVYVKLEYPTRYDLAMTNRRLQEVQKRLADLPELRHSLATVGKVEGIVGKSSEGVYLAQLILKFSERNERSITLDELMDRIRQRLGDYPEAVVTINKPGAIGGQSSPVEMEIAGQSLETLDRLAIRTQKFADEIPGLTDVDTTVRPGKPEIRIRPNRPVLSDRNIPAVNIGMALRGNLEGLTAGTFKQNARNYDIVVLLDKEEGKGQVDQFQFPGEPGSPVLLETIASVNEGQAPVQITRKNKQRVSKLFANLKGDLPLGAAVDKINTAIRQKGQFPPGYEQSFTGQYEVMAEAQGDFREAMLIAILLTVLTLAAILESFKQPLLILVTLPLAIIGVMWALWLVKLSMDIFVLVGCVMMVGIVVNNAILIMDQFNVHVAEGVPRHKAMISAACERFRPILMTTVAAVLGMYPLMVGKGIGAEMRNGIGAACVGGILVSGVLTLILMPVLYDLFTRKGASRQTEAH